VNPTLLTAELTLTRILNQGFSRNVPDVQRPHEFTALLCPVTQFCPDGVGVTLFYRNWPQILTLTLELSVTLTLTPRYRIFLPELGRRLLGCRAVCTSKTRRCFCYLCNLPLYITGLYHIVNWLTPTVTPEVPKENDKPPMQEPQSKHLLALTQERWIYPITNHNLVSDPSTDQSL